MRSPHLHSRSFLAGCGLALVVLLGMGQKASPSAPRLEYRIANDVQDKDLAQLAEEGWEYAGYLGEGVKGTGNDETLWRRPVQ